MSDTLHVKFTAVEQVYQHIETVALLPCPFCGGANVYFTDHPEDTEVFLVECRECYCNGPTASIDDPQEAIRLWNRRAGPAFVKLDEAELPT